MCHAALPSIFTFVRKESMTWRARRALRQHRLPGMMRPRGLAGERRLSIAACPARFALAVGDGHVGPVSDAGVRTLAAAGLVGARAAAGGSLG